MNKKHVHSAGFVRIARCPQLIITTIISFVVLFINIVPIDADVPDDSLHNYFGRGLRHGLLDAFNKDRCGKGDFNLLMNYYSPGFGCTDETPIKTRHLVQPSERKSQKSWAGRSKLRLTKGFRVKGSDFPSYVRVRFTYLHKQENKPDQISTWSCNGVIIHRDLVLTNSDCIPLNKFDTTINGDVLGGSPQVVNGEYERSQRRYIYGVCINPDNFRSRADPNARPLAKDTFALVKLATPLRYNSYIQPVCLDLYRGVSEDAICTLVSYSDPVELDPEKETKIYNLLSGVFVRKCRFPSTLIKQRLDDNRGFVDVNYPQPNATCYTSQVDENYPGSPCRLDTGSTVYCFDTCNPLDIRMYATAVLDFPLGPRPCYTYGANYFGFIGIHEHAANLLNLIRNCIKSESFIPKDGFNITRARRDIDDKDDHYSGHESNGNSPNDNQANIGEEAHKWIYFDKKLR